MQNDKISVIQLSGHVQYENTLRFDSIVLPRHMKKRQIADWLVRSIGFISIIFTIAFLVAVLIHIAVKGIGWLNLHFLIHTLSVFPEKAGILNAITGSFALMAIVMPVTLVLGAATALYLEEYASKYFFSRLIQIFISNLAGVPSVIFGLLGLSVFGRLMGLRASILSGGLTLSLLALPVVIVAAQEAIRSVPFELREASYALGATHWTTIWRVVLPTAMPGLLTGSILAVSRAIGETAPLVVLGIPALIMKMPDSLLDDFTALPVQIYYWTLDAVLTPEYENLASAAIIVLLVLLLSLNLAAVLIRQRYARLRSS